MEKVLADIALGTGVLAAALSLLIPFALGRVAGRERRPSAVAGIVLGALLTATLFLLSLPKDAPFSPGQRLGWGLLIGGVVALFAAFGAARLARPSHGYWPYPSMFALGLSLSATSLLFLLFPSDPADALLGGALGFVMVAGIFRSLSPETAQPMARAVAATAVGGADLAADTNSDAAGPEPARSGAAPLDFGLALEAAAALTATLAAACCLAAYHFDRSEQHGWWAYPLALAAFWVIGQLLAYLAAAQPRLARYPVLLSVIACAPPVALALGFGSLLAARLDPSQRLAALLTVGIATAALILWIALTSTAATDPLPSGIQAGALTTGLLLLLLVLAFKALGGIGAAFLLIAAWGVVVSALGLGGPAARIPLQGLALGANFLLVRLFLERFGVALSGVETSLHYTLIGLLLGVLLPFLFCSLRLRPGAGKALLLLALGGLSPLLALALWGLDAALGLLVGLTAAQALVLLLLPLASGRPREAAWIAPTGLLTLGSALVLVQFSRALAFLYQMPRASKAYLAIAIALAALLCIIGVGLLRLWNARHLVRAQGDR